MFQREAVILSTKATSNAASELRTLLQSRSVGCYNLSADHPTVLRSLLRDRAQETPVYNITGTPAIILYTLVDDTGNGPITKIVKYDTEESLTQLAHALRGSQAERQAPAVAAPDESFTSDLNKLTSIPEASVPGATESDRDFIATQDGRGDLRTVRDSPTNAVQHPTRPLATISGTSPLTLSQKVEKMRSGRK